MADKQREFIENERRQYQSPVELLKRLAELYGDDFEQKLSYDDSRKVISEAMLWASWHDLAMQDFLAEQYEPRSKKDEESPRQYVKKVLDALKVAANHLQRGQQLGLSDLEQRVVDTLWGWVPHDYPENYVACAREVARAIVGLLPPEAKSPTEVGYEQYCDSVMHEVKQLAAKHGMELDTSGYNLTMGYFNEWLSDEYGIVLDDAWDRDA